VKLKGLLMRNRADNNQESIVADLRNIGCSVEVLSQVGGGCPDILVGYRGDNYLMEIKGQRGLLSDDQVEWHMGWNGQVAIVRSFDDALKVIKQVMSKGA